MSTKPSSVLGWLASGAGAGITEPDSTTKTDGFSNGYAYPAEFFNWFWELTSEWVQYLDDLFPDGEIDVGSALLSSLANSLKARFKFWAAANTTSTRTLLFQVGLGGARSVAVYAYTTTNLGYTVEVAINAEFDGSVWNRVAGATNSTLLRFDQDGTARWAWRDDGAADGWADSYAGSAGAGTGWTTIGSVSLLTTTLNNNVDIDGQIDVEGTATFQAQTTFQDVRVNGTIGGSGGGTLTTTAGLAVTGAATVTGNTTIDHLDLGGAHATGNVIVDGTLQVDGNVTLGNATSDTVTVAGSITADSGLGFPDLDFSLQSFTGSGPNALQHMQGVTMPAGGRSYRAVAGSVVGMWAWVAANDGSDFATVDSSRTVRLTVKEGTLDSGGSITSSSTLGYIDITAGNFGNRVDGIGISWSYAANKVLYVEATTIGGTITAKTVVVKLQVKE